MNPPVGTADTFHSSWPTAHLMSSGVQPLGHGGLHHRRIQLQEGTERQHTWCVLFPLYFQHTHNRHVHIVGESHVPCQGW